MSHKSAKIAALIEACRGQAWDPHYLGFFVCFNRQMYFEAHDVLEELWLEDRHGPDGNFHKGLIQLAGAFVHLQKDRPGPSAALLKLARANFAPYPVAHLGIDLEGVRKLISEWLEEIERGQFRVNPLRPDHVPQLELPTLARGLPTPHGVRLA